MRASLFLPFHFKEPSRYFQISDIMLLNRRFLHYFLIAFPPQEKIGVFFYRGTGLKGTKNNLSGFYTTLK